MRTVRAGIERSGAEKFARAGLHNGKDAGWVGRQLRGRFLFAHGGDEGKRGPHQIGRRGESGRKAGIEKSQILIADLSEQPGLVIDDKQRNVAPEQAMQDGGVVGNRTGHDIILRGQPVEGSARQSLLFGRIHS